MQLSASLLPFDLPAVGTGVVPAGASPAANVAAPADFGTLLNAESTSVAPTRREPEVLGAEATTSLVASELAEEFPFVEDLTRPAPDEMPRRSIELPSDVLPQAVFPSATPPVAAPSVAPEAETLPEALSGDAREHGTITSQTSDREIAAKDGRHSRVVSREAMPTPSSSSESVERPGRSHRMGRDEAENEAPRSRTPLDGGGVQRGNLTDERRAALARPADAPVFETPQTVASAITASPEVDRGFLETRSMSANDPAATPARVEAGDAPVIRSSTGAAALSRTDHQTQTPARNVTAPQPVQSDEPADHSQRAPVAGAGAEHRGVSVVDSNVASRAPSSLSAETRPEVLVATTPTPAAFTAVSRIQNSDIPTAVATETIGTENSATPSAKFAASSSRRIQTPLAVYAAAEKNTEVAKPENVESGERPLGTNVAKAEAPMPVADLAPASSPHAIERMSQAVAPLASEFSLGEEHSEPIEIAQAARRAVNAAVAVTEQFAAERKPAVTLKFTVSGVDLGVRVELRGENIHTTFRTDSPELRAALAQEWNHVAAAQAGDRAARLAEPVFTSNHNNAPASTSAHSHGSTPSDSGAGEQRGFQQRHEDAAAADWARFRAASRASHSTPTPLPEPAFAARAVASVAPGRLRTFA